MDKNWHAVGLKNILEEFKTTDKGLNEAEASYRLIKFGLNELVAKKPTSPLTIFFRQFKSFLILILIVAAIISAALTFVLDSIVILVIVILNAIIGFFQEHRAEKSMEALKKLIAQKARVIRNKRIRTVLATKLVPGDILILEAGDRVPADCRLIDAIELRVDESALTGESVSVQKQKINILKKETAVADRKNMIFMGTVVTQGKAKAVVVGTGMKTEIGKIAHLIETTKEKPTPLQIKMKEIGKTLGTVIIFICTVVFLIGLLRGEPLFPMFLTAVSLAVAAVPEGLPAVITIALALGLERMIKCNAVVRELPAVETLGCTNVICADKTGTLTENEMTVRKVYVDKQIISIGGEGYEPKGRFTLKNAVLNPQKNKTLTLMLKTAALCNSSSVYPEDDDWEITGDPTEAALLVAAMKARISKEDLEKENKYITEIPFSSERKMMSAVYSNKKDKFIYTKGAVEVVLDKCKFIYENNRIRKLTEKDREHILETNHKMANEALRVLGFAYKKIHQPKYTENDLIFLGLMGMIDPPRPEVKEAIKLCKQAGVKVVMITGDHKITAVAIAKELRLLGSGEVLTGAELSELDDLDFDKKVEKISVYARVSPEHKTRIVSALQRKGYVVAVTGDGVNDAPALKNANIGVAMGIKGTDVAKEAADMILEDDNFATIVSAVEEGRGIYDNIKKFVNYLLTSNVGEILVIFVASLIGLGLPLIAIQILWINLLTDGLPAVALAADPKAPNIMQRKPRSIKEKVIDKHMAYSIVFVGILMCIGTLALFKWALLRGASINEARTVAFATIVMFEMVRIQVVRSEYNIKFFSNKYLILSIILSILLMLVVVYMPPLQVMFHTTALGLTEWAGILLVSATVFFIVLFRKILRL